MSRLLPMLALAAAAPVAAIAQAKPKARPSPPQTTAPRQPAAAGVPSSAVPAGRAAGRVLTEDGRPVADAEIRIEGMNMAGGQIHAYPRTDAGGRYATRVPDGNVRVTAIVEVDYEGQRYHVKLHPADGRNDPIDTQARGVAKDFVFRRSGLRPGADPSKPQSHYGGYGSVLLGDPTQWSPRGAFPAAGSGVEVTFTPDGPLLDGGAGQPVTVQCAGCVKAPESYYGESAPSTEATSFRAVPAGRYRVTARVIGPEGSAQPALVGVRTQLAGVAPTKPAPSAVATFPPYVLAGSEPGVGALTIFVLPAPR